MNNPSAVALAEQAERDGFEAKTVRRIAWHFIPLLMLSYLAAYIDRVNVGFAALTMNKDLGLTTLQYGHAAGLFFIGYFIAEFPSNLILVKVGPRRWFARIMVSMGIVACATAFVTGPWTFYGARLLLGLAEAGLLPGVIWFIRCWIPQKYRARYLALFLLAIPLSSFIGSPISGLILGLSGWMGLQGWQWLFILEGIPCAVLGFVILFRLTETPVEATWLTPAQREWLSQSLAAEQNVLLKGEAVRTWALLGDIRVWAYGTAFFCVLIGSYGLSLWLPQIVKAFGLTNFQTGLVTAIPFAFGCIATITWARRSDVKRERSFHTALPAILSAAGLGACVLTRSPTLTMIALSVAAIGIFGLRGPFFALTAEAFSDDNSAAGIALVGTLSALAGFVGPQVVGLLRTLSGNFNSSLLFLAIMSLLGGVIVLVRGHYVYKALVARQSGLA